MYKRVISKKSIYSIVYVLLIGLTALCAEAVSGKKDIAVFRLSQSGVMPTEVAARIDQRITAAVASFRRFNVIGMQYRLNTADVSVFINKIRESKEQLSDLPETVLSGEEAFTRADWERLTGAFLVFAPRITAYQESILYDDAIVDGKKAVKQFWEIKIEGALSIVDVSGTAGERIIPFSVVRIFTRRSDAIDSAIDAVTDAVYDAVKFEPEFTLSSGILEIDRQHNTVTIELGSNMGIRVGDEYTLQKPIVTAGHSSSVETGFFIISEVHDTFSIGKIVYATQPVVEGDSVKEQPYYNLILQGYGGITVPLTGVKQGKAKDYMRVQPTFGIKGIYRYNFHFSVSFGYEYAIQQPIGQSSAADAKPLRLSPFGMMYMGLGVHNFYMARFKITPEIQFCYSGVSVGAQNASSTQRNNGFTVTASQLGGRALVSADYFISRNWTAGVSAGLGYMHSLTDARGIAERLRYAGFLSAADAAKVSQYDWDMLSSHLNFYCFIGLTRRF